jgi:diguanylate cyclase (GGDEF)-like protein
MPVMSGDKFHNELAGNPDFRKIPFIFLSAITDRHLIIERKMRGAVAYLSKPIDPADFLFTAEVHVKNYMEYKETLQAAAIDELTGLNNRKFMIKLLQDRLAVRMLRELSVVFIDIDRFKLVNDTHGHQAGDAVLAKIGHLLQRSLRKYDFAGRYGGEEFIAVLPDTKLDEAVIAAEKLRLLISEKGITYGNETIRCTASFGVASLLDEEPNLRRELEIDSLRALYVVSDNKTADWVRIEEKKGRIADLLIRYADEALYEAKTSACLTCGFKSVSPTDFGEGSCPECGSRSLKPGRNRVMRH